MFKLLSPSIRLRLINTRSYIGLPIPKGQRLSPKDFPKDAKLKIKGQQALKNKAKQPAIHHPLYTDIPTALKYLRAAEVGQPAKKTTISISFTVIPEKGSIPLRGSVFFPKQIKDTKLLVLTHNQLIIDKYNNELKNENIEIGGESLIKQISEGIFKIDKFNQCFASPEIIKDLKPIAKILGLKGLMPTPKRNTVSENLSKLIEENFGAVDFKQKGMQLSIAIGRCDFSDLEILNNLKAASNAIYNAEPSGTKKPNLIGQCHISSTLGPSLVIDIKP